jgi:hypothetical protein
MGRRLFASGSAIPRRRLIDQPRQVLRRASGIEPVADIALRRKVGQAQDPDLSRYARNGATDGFDMLLTVRVMVREEDHGPAA